jgi:AmiR/NasT family two-component response regulator
MTSVAITSGLSGQASQPTEAGSPGDSGGPVGQGAGPAPNGSAGKGNGAKGVDQPLRVVLVEDEVIVAWDIAETLKRLGYNIVGMAETADQALRLTETLAPDLILMDIRLTGRPDGIEAARMIRERTGRGVIYLTAHADLATMERAAATEPLGYVFKPFSQEGLRTALQRATGREAAAGS